MLPNIFECKDHVPFSFQDLLTKVTSQFLHTKSTFFWVNKDGWFLFPQQEVQLAKYFLYCKTLYPMDHVDVTWLESDPTLSQHGILLGKLYAEHFLHKDDHSAEDDSLVRILLQEFFLSIKNIFHSIQIHLKHRHSDGQSLAKSDVIKNRTSEILVKIHLIEELLYAGDSFSSIDKNILEIFKLLLRMSGGRAYLSGSVHDLFLCYTWASKIYI